MANTFYVKSGATKPKLRNRLFDENGSPLRIDGSVIMRVKPRYSSAIDIPTVLLDQNDEDTVGMMDVDKPGIDPVTSNPIEVGEHDVEWRVTSGSDLLIFPTEESPFDVPTYDKLVVLKSL